MGQNISHLRKLVALIVIFVIIEMELQLIFMAVSHPAIAAGKGLFPGGNTPLSGLLCCGDSTFPGIGLPAVAASGMIVANTIAPVQKHLQYISETFG
ncbi:MAG: hypothetical protein AN487_16940 [Anabaena sp. CRKS33]|jgi:phytoene dehydrogenase-like protein|nr:MAG: hypothetical protein AN487_16940 [Anabaena sp. CRKS33]